MFSIVSMCDARSQLLQGTFVRVCFTYMDTYNVTHTISLYSKLYT